MEIPIPGKAIFMLKVGPACGCFAKTILIFFLWTSSAFMPYDDIDISKYWLRYWLVALQHLAITWTIVDLSFMMSSDIHVRAFSPEVP